MIVLWSGGCDSTLMLLDLVKEASQNSPIRTISINHECIGGKGRSARLQIRAILEARKLPITFSEIDIKDGEKNVCMQIGKDGFSLQPSIWISEAMRYLSENEDLYVGYIKTDCVWHKMHELRSAFEWLQKLSGKTGTLKTPLEWCSKCEVLKELKKDKDIFDKTWWCEYNNESPCGVCEPCRTHNTALWQISQKWDDLIYKEEIKKDEEV